MMDRDSSPRTVSLIHPVETAYSRSHPRSSEETQPHLTEPQQQQQQQSEMCPPGKGNTPNHTTEVMLPGAGEGVPS